MEKKKLIIIIVLVLIFVIIGILIWKNNNSAPANNIVAEDNNETIVYQSDSYIQYKFDFTDIVDETKEYKIEGYKLIFNIISEGLPSFQFGENEKVETLAREYDVYYLIDTKSVIIANYTDFGTGLYFGDSEGIYNLSDVVKGAYSFENFVIKDNVFSFDAKNYSKDNYRVTLDDNIFSVNFDDYTQYTEDTYPMELSYKYNLSNKDFKYEQFEITTTKTIKELYEEINSAYDEVTTTYNEETVDTTTEGEA